MNVFEDQKFLLRTHDPGGGPGERLRLSWREIMTGEDRPLRFDYPLEYMNVAALGLCSALTQTVLEPKDIRELSDRIEKKLSDEEIETAIAPYRKSFSLNGSHRFLQGSEPERDKKGRYKKAGDLSEVLLTVKKGDKEFLNRPGSDWCVRPDQIALLLFSRMTFYEKSAGRGYLTGTSGNLEIRTFPIDRTSLRRTIWLNVLNRESQQGLFTDASSDDGYDEWMWHSLPENGEVARGGISLRAGLFWMVANAWIVIDSLEDERTCLMTGDRVAEGEQAGTAVVVTPTGVRYGVSKDPSNEKSGADSFFPHPNGPYKEIRPEKKPAFTVHHAVEESRGLVGSVAGLLFAHREGSTRETRYPAPVVEQLHNLRHHREDVLDEGSNRIDLLCFGFHMLSSKKNVHGAYAIESYTYPVLGTSEEEIEPWMETAEGIVGKAVKVTKEVEYALHRGIQRCTLIETDVNEDEGRYSFKESSKVSDVGIQRSASEELWGAAAEQMRRLIRRIAEIGDDTQALRSAAGELGEEWEDSVVAAAERIFYRYFDSYSASPRHIAAAHSGRFLFNALVRKATTTQQRRSESQKELQAVEVADD